MYSLLRDNHGWCRLKIDHNIRGPVNDTDAGRPTDQFRALSVSLYLVVTSCGQMATYEHRPGLVVPANRKPLIVNFC